MPEKDYVHAVYVVGVILIFAPIVQGIISILAQQYGGPANYDVSAGHIAGLFGTAGFMMILYVAYKRFFEGLRSVKTKPADDK